MFQIKLVKKVKVPPERQDEIVTMKERLIENLQIHLANAESQFAIRNQVLEPKVGKWVYQGN